MIDVTVVLLENAVPSTSLAPLEIFTFAGVLWHRLRGEKERPYFRVRSASLDGRATCHAVPVQLSPQGSIRDVRKTDLIIVPAGDLDLARSHSMNARLIPWLRRWHERGASIAGICTGVGLLAAAGILDGRQATTHWSLADQYRLAFPRVRWSPERFVTESQNVFCGGGVYASIDLSLYLVEKYCGHEVAVQTAQALLLQTPRVWQTSYAVDPPSSSHDDEAIQKTQSWLYRNFRTPTGVEQLAAQAGMSPRNFARRFKAATGESPLRYLHRLRIDSARHLLESRGKAISEVSRAVGYDDPDFFRRLFTRYTGVPPRAYRARFGAPAHRV